VWRDVQGAILFDDLDIVTDLESYQRKQFIRQVDSTVLAVRLNAKCPMLVQA